MTTDDTDNTDRAGLLPSPHLCLFLLLLLAGCRAAGPGPGDLGKRKPKPAPPPGWALSWSYAYAEPNSSNYISFRVYQCTNLAAGQWSLVGVTNGWRWPVSNRWPAEFFRVRATNWYGKGESP